MELDRVIPITFCVCFKTESERAASISNPDSKLPYNKLPYKTYIKINVSFFLQRASSDLLLICSRHLGKRFPFGFG